MINRAWRPLTGSPVPRGQLGYGPRMSVRASIAIGGATGGGIGWLIGSVLEPLGREPELPILLAVCALIGTVFGVFAGLAYGSGRRIQGHSLALLGFIACVVVGLIILVVTSLPL